jgi:hypothetical protein
VDLGTARAHQIKGDQGGSENDEDELVKKQKTLYPNNDTLSVATATT